MNKHSKYDSLYDEMEEAVANYWTSRIINIFNKCQDAVYAAMRVKLEMPNFQIADGMHDWGQWDASKRLIRLNKRLITEFEEGALAHVVKHEVAHQIVSEIFQMDGGCMSHGEFWKNACAMVGCDDRRCASVDFLSGFAHSGKGNPIISKIQKLLNKGNDSAVTMEESTLFLQKAQELLDQHQLSINMATGEVENAIIFNIGRPSGLFYKRCPTWLHLLGELVQSHYHVNYFIHHTMHGYCVMLYGEPQNLEVANYVLSAIIVQSRYMFDIAYENHLERMNNDSDYFMQNSKNTWSEKKGEYIRRAKKFTYATFMYYLLTEYSRKLSANKKVDYNLANHNALILDRAAKREAEMFKKYSLRRSGMSASANGSSSSAGREAGRNLTINPGVRGGGRSIPALIA